MQVKRWSRCVPLTALIALVCVHVLGPAKASCYDGDASYCSSWSFCDPFSFGGIEVGGELIWWKPCIDHSEYAVVFNTPGTGNAKVRYKSLCPRWEAGGRVWGYAPHILCDCCGLSASWTGINSWDSTSTSVPELSNKEISAPSLGNPLDMVLIDELKVCWRVYYYDYDVLVSYSYCCGNCSVFRPFVGFAGLILEQKNHLEVDVEALDSKGKFDIKWKSNLYAYGLRAGAEYECKIVDSFSVFGKFTASVLTGEPDTKNVQSGKLESQQISRLKISENACYRAYPGYHLSAGVMYHCCIFDGDFALRLGYEFVEWHNLPHQRRLIHGDATQGTDSTNRSFGWQGLFVGGSLSF